MASLLLAILNFICCSFINFLNWLRLLLLIETYSLISASFDFTWLFIFPFSIYVCPIIILESHVSFKIDGNFPYFNWLDRGRDSSVILDCGFRLRLHRPALFLTYAKLIFLYWCWLYGVNLSKRGCFWRLPLNDLLTDFFVDWQNFWLIIFPLQALFLCSFYRNLSVAASHLHPPSTP